MNFIQRLQRNIRAKLILREADKILKDYPELSYRQAFCKALEIYGLDYTPLYKKWSEGNDGR